MRRLAVAIAAVVCATALAHADEPASSGAVQRLAGVDIEGDLGEPKDRLLRFLGLVPEAPFGKEEQSRLDGLLSKLNYRQVGTEVRPAGPGHVRLHLVLEPVRVVRNVVVRHDWPFFDDEIIRHLTVRTGVPLVADSKLRALLEAEADKVRKYLANEGYFEATVDIEPHIAMVGVPSRPRPQWIDLVVVLNLGRSYQLGMIEPTYDHPDGAERLSREKLYEIFHHWLRFKVSEMREDQKKAEKVLREQGFPAARVTCDFDFERDADRRTHKIRLLVRVQEKRRVEVRFVGNRAVTGSELRDQLTLFTAGAYDQVELNESARMIQKEYQKRGYFEARVSFRRSLRPPPPDKPGHEVEEVTFTIDEGPELKVRRVDIMSETGAPLTFAQEDLKDKAELETRPFPPLGSIGLGEGGYVTQTQLSQDADRLVNLYKSRGFPLVRVRAEVARDPAAFDALGVFGAESSGAGGGGDLYVRFIVDEGRRELVDHVEVSFIGAHVKDETDVLRAIKTGAGMPFTPQAINEDLEGRVKDLYKSSGHPLVKIDPTESSWNEAHDRVTLRYIITEGPEVRFGAILVRGNFKTRTFVIRRDLPFKPGDLFDYTKIEAAENNLQTHVIFNAARVEPQFPEEGDVGLGTVTVPVLVTVQEHYLESAGGITFALGAASDRLPDYVYASVAYQWPNVFGIGSQFELKGEYAFLAAARHDPVSWSVSARYTDLRVLGPGWRLDLNLFLRDEVTARFGLVRSFGGSLGLTRNVTPTLRAFVRYDMYQANLSVAFLRILGNDDLSSVQDHTLITRAVSGLVWDKRVAADGAPNPLAPYKGWLLSGSAGYSHPNWLPAPTQYLVFDGQALGILPFKLRGVEFSLLGNLRYSHGIPLGGQSALPLTERFYAGGDTTTRGYDPDTLKAEIIYSNPSPLGGASGFRVVPEGGNIRFLNTIELQFPIAKSFLGLPLSWSGAVFWDMGAIVNGLDQVHWQDFRHSIGISVLRLLTPVGPLSVEYAYPLTQTLAEERWKTSPWYTHFPGRIHFNWGIPLSRL